MELSNTFIAILLGVVSGLMAILLTRWFYKKMGWPLIKDKKTNSTNKTKNNNENTK